MNITVLGAGAWGTALAIHFAKHGHHVTMWSHRAEHAKQMQQTRNNEAYLAGFAFPPQLNIQSDFNAALDHSELVLIVTPVGGLRSSLEQLKAAGKAHLPILTACKGFELKSGLLPFQVAQEILPLHPKIGVLSGPSFAEELAMQQPCAVCLASENFEWIQTLALQLNTHVMRLYANHDIIGVSVGGAVKNVMAIATGLSDGLQCGLNARAALITRGLAEISRLAEALGAEHKTMMGLAGMGDLILTCTGALSRNRKVGLGLAEGKNLTQILHELGHVAEGVATIAEVHRIAQYHHIDMPITRTLYQLLQETISIHDVVEQLMQRDPTNE